jgi:hypothetical protein
MQSNLRTPLFFPTNVFALTLTNLLLFAVRNEPSSSTVDYIDLPNHTEHVRTIRRPYTGISASLPKPNPDVAVQQTRRSLRRSGPSSGHVHHIFILVLGTAFVFVILFVAPPRFCMMINIIVVSSSLLRLVELNKFLMGLYIRRGIIVIR